jgi:hypothetical protein
MWVVLRRHCLRRFSILECVLRLWLGGMGLLVGAEFMVRL